MQIKPEWYVAAEFENNEYKIERQVNNCENQRFKIYKKVYKPDDEFNLVPKLRELKTLNTLGELREFFKSIRTEECQ